MDRGKGDSREAGYEAFMITHDLSMDVQTNVVEAEVMKSTRCLIIYVWVMIERNKKCFYYRV